MRMKKKRHGSERIALLSALVVENPTNLSKNLNEVYGNSNPLRIEIGCGKGDFIRGKSVQEPDYNYLAIDYWRLEVCDRPKGTVIIVR